MCDEDDRSSRGVGGVAHVREVGQEVPRVCEDVVLQAQRLSVDDERVVAPDHDPRGGAGVREEVERPVDLGFVGPGGVSLAAEFVEPQPRGRLERVLPQHVPAASRRVLLPAEQGLRVGPSQRRVPQQFLDGPGPDEGGRLGRLHRRSGIPPTAPLPRVHGVAPDAVDQDDAVDGLGVRTRTPTGPIFVAETPVQERTKQAKEG
ncbi:hypothetical protein VTK73DRAFT_9467 [Phialemonium thermophilum]|uniref:Uncharacterized protein n=1 Tax=Phialemonium thermophilum TaxID=223376 RepID=A0ABR3W207_9PEZI